MKVCPRCAYIKSEEDFNKNKNTKDGLQNYCRECMHKYNTNRKSAKESKSNQERWNSYMGADFSNARQCVDCMEVKDWQKFCLGADHLVNLCRDCHRVRVTRRVEVIPEIGKGRKKTNTNMQDLLAFLATKEDATS